MSARLEREAPRIAVAIGAVAVALALRCRFVQDDAFISFTYARELVAGRGLTWFGERVEGYTNFLWVLWMALGLRLGVEPVAWSYSGGLLAFVTTLWATWHLARSVLGEAAPSLLALFLLATNYTVLAYATGGLETMLQTALLTLAGWQTVRYLGQSDLAAGRCGWVSLLVGLAILTRLDSALPGGLLLLAALRHAWSRSRPALLALCLPCALLVGAWLAWKAIYYGNLLPNTYYAKVGVDAAMLRNGLRYLARFAHAYWLWAVPLLAAGAAIVHRGRHPAAGRASEVRLLLLILLAWCAYLVAIGGDFMEFRMLVPLAPALFILLALVVWRATWGTLAVRSGVAALAAGLLAVASASHASTFRGITPDRALDSVPALATFYGVYPAGDWDALGLELKAALGDTGAVVALHAVGAIPFYSGLRTIDIYGLSDAWVARHGAPAPPSYTRPGHRRQATLAYLRERGVNFVIAHPTLVTESAASAPGSEAFFQRWVRNTIFFDRAPIREATLVFLPVVSRSRLVLWYLTPAPQLDTRIRERGWQTRTVQVPE